MRNKKGKVNSMKKYLDYRAELDRVVEEVKGTPEGSKTEVFYNTKTGAMRTVFCGTTSEFSNPATISYDEVQVDILGRDVIWCFDEYGDFADDELAAEIDAKLQFEIEQRKRENE